MRFLQASTKLVLDEIFFMSHNVINALKNFLKIFESKGLTCFQGKNVSVITKQLHAAVVSLDEVGALPIETYGDILRGFTNLVMKTSRQSSSTF